MNYLGPLCAGMHPAMEGLNLKHFRASCYLVEVSDEAGVNGPIMEGDQLVVDEARPVRHADLVVAELTASSGFSVPAGSAVPNG
ncbi:hypothetical protein HNO52_06620 [Billgrantia diversa]|uniref:hypothetical protein n=1 Tax=Halomonas sp. MCCC 1A13316 TaxID=2733487 RepID=UPI0018A66E2A|nr:hypothetical protein [Halomonas sp. MCCC 1A13316]QOR38220.1 hypothetical protein HNO52_06620 [Halomonas sp. MCCC 1A13316]